MAQRYLHIDITSCQAPKHAEGPCGDVVAQRRTDVGTDIILCDGIGSGIKAHIAATLHVSRMQKLLAEGFSLRHTFASVIATVDKWRDPAKPYAAITLARILNDGEVTILTYDAPAPVLVSRGHADVLPQRPFVIDNAVAQQSSCFLAPGEGVLFFSDGITQAGIGNGSAEGWTSEGVAGHASRLLASGHSLAGIPESIRQEALRLDGNVGRDDMTVVSAHCRLGKTLHILTGPPADKRLDADVVNRFLAMDGPKVVCGATTAAIVARVTGRKLAIDREPTSLIAPPKYALEGIDLVTEGAVTLNQLCNILDVPEEEFEEINPVTELADLLQQADRVSFILGRGANPANDSMGFRQQGIIKREAIVPLLAKKLRARGKLVMVNAI
ncbi:MAG: SpoIIE family protein phosphatase [Phycisphaerales bacterium]